MTLSRLSLGALLVAPVRLALGLAGLGVGVALGERAGAALLLFALGALATAFALVADRRGGIFAPRSEPEPAPAGAREAGRLELVWQSLLPSTVGVSALAAIAYAAGQRGLGALLSGGVAGMGLAALVSGAAMAWQERASGERLLLDRRARRLYTRAHR